MSGFTVEAFRPVLATSLSSLVDTESVDTLLNSVCDSLSTFMAQLPAPVKTRAPRKPRQVVEAPAASETAPAPAAETETATTKKTRKHRTPRDPNAPVKAKKYNAYNMFVQHTMRNHPDLSAKRVKNEDGTTTGLSSTDKMRRCSTEWRELSAEAKESWKEKAKAHNDALPADAPAATEEQVSA